MIIYVNVIIFLVFIGLSYKFIFVFFLIYVRKLSNVWMYVNVIILKNYNKWMNE